MEQGAFYYEYKEAQAPDVSGGANRMQNGRLTMDRAFWLEAT
jgi:hypothetical protein